MSASVINSAGVVRRLDGKAAPEEVVTEADVQSPGKLSKTLARLLVTVAELRRAWAPSRIDFEDVPVGTGGAQVTLAHGFNGRVRWYLVGWQSSGTAAPVLRESTATVSDAATLVLQSYVAGTACIRVEAAG